MDMDRVKFFPDFLLFHLLDRVYTSTSSTSDSGSCLLSSFCGYRSTQYFNGSADSIQTGSDSGSSIMIQRMGNPISSLLTFLFLFFPKSFPHSRHFVQTPKIHLDTECETC